MQQTGLEESQKVDERLKRIDEALDVYEKKVGLGNVSAPSEVDRLLSLSTTDLSKLTAEECGNAAYILTRYAHYVQKECNRETSRITWSTEELSLTIADEIGKYKGYSFDERKFQAIKHNSAAAKLNKIKTYAQQRRDRLEYQAMYIENMAKRLDSLQQTKRRDRG